MNGKMVKTMSLQYLSDIHLEFYNDEVTHLVDQIVPVAPVCVLAGDIGYPFEATYRQFLEGLSQKFEHIVLIHGNHEYYQFGKNKGKTMAEIVEETHALCTSLPNVHFLYDTTWDYLNVRFIGTVLWSKIVKPMYLINDSRCIGEFSVDGWNRLHRRHREWLHTSLNTAAADGKQAVVVTHHLPSMTLVSDKWRRNPINQCFASECDDLIRSPAVVWIYGHTHEPGESVINGVQCVANPIGYPGEHAKPNYTAVMTIDTNIKN